MQLRRLELVGFKTFVDRTELEFHPGITAIVGPNGSGKSNLMDGIRWALGETNARLLRGSRMDDIIFAGTASRRPHSLARVSLTLENGAGDLPLEFSEVTVSRAVTRGGEGEYAINGLDCRLRDIQMLFLGTGLGGRSYALIGQGEVDAVLRATPLERRQWLEEAAGLARQKRQRTEAERRLGHAQAHLDRAGDLLSELEAHQQALAAQAEAAALHRSHSEELRDLELALYADEARRLLGAARRLASQMVGERQEAAGAAARADAASTAVAEVEAQVAALTAQWEDGQQALLGGAEELAVRAAEVQQAERRLDAQRTHHQHLMDEAGRLLEERARVAADAEVLRLEAAVVEDQREALRRELADATVGFSDASAAAEASESRLSLARPDAVGVARTLAQARSDLAALCARAEVLGQSVAATEERAAALREAAARISSALESARRARDEARRTLEQAEDALASATRTADECRRGLDASAERQRAAELEEHGLQSRLASMEEAHAQFVGFEEGARGVLLAARADPARFPELCGALADQIEVSDKYQPALAAALGRRLHCLVVDSRAAIQAISSFLEAEGIGGAAVLALDAVRARHPSAPLPADGAYVRAADVVISDAAIRPAVDALLGDVAIVADLDCAWGLFASGFSGRIVTQDGTLLSPDGVLWLRGRRGRDLMPLGRNQALAALRSDASRASSRRETAQMQRLAAAEQAAATEAALSARRAERGAAAAALTECSQRLAQQEAEAARIAVDEAALAAEVASRGLELHIRRAEVDRLAADVRRLEDEAGYMETRLVELEQEARRLGGAREALAQEVAARQVALAQVDGNLEALRGRLRDRTAAIEELEARRAGLARDAERISAELDAAAEHRREAVAAHDAVLAGQAAGKARLERLAAERAGLRDRLVVLGAELHAAIEAARAREAALHRAELRSAQADAELAAAAQRLNEQYGIALEEAASRRLEASRDEARRHLDELRTALRELGPVNLRAIEEHAILTARVEALRGRTHDVRAAADALRHSIAVINAALRVRFDQTFVEVDREFGRLFQQLFEGGQGSLELVEDELGAEPGLEVIAQLPGKKRRSLVALSGGERVLVALALIFAMLRVHPSPFCIFDEVEAALDDENTRRFTGLLRDLAQQTQVLIITHNKGTMAAADVLYGVTMQELGTSSLVSLRLVPSQNGGEPEPREELGVREPSRQREAVALPGE
ncbi:MAG: chromosome segregation protein SMC [bacterium]|nr:chromosome segregation protein SMC [bacterium]